MTKKSPEGAGIKEIYTTTKRVVSKLLFGDNSLPQNVIKTLKEYGDYTLVEGSINRKQISSAINIALNVTSLGQFQQNLENTPYDKLFHLSLDIKLSNNKILKIEKNERITLTVISSFGNSNNDMKISLPSITLNDFVNNGYKEMGNKFFTYDANQNNCQYFILGLLRGSNCLTEEARVFIKQDTEELFENIPWTKRIMDTFTDIGAKASIIAQGGDIPQHVKTYQHFASYYYHNVSKNQTLTQMLKDPKFKKAYAKFKNKK